MVQRIMGLPGYGGGHLSLDIGNGPMSSAPYSMFFQTYVEPVPEPKCELVSAALLLGLVLLRRKFRQIQ